MRQWQDWKEINVIIYTFKPILEFEQLHYFIDV